MLVETHLYPAVWRCPDAKTDEDGKDLFKWRKQYTHFLAQRTILHQDLPQRFVPATDYGPVVVAIGGLRPDYATRDAAAEMREAAKQAAARLPSKCWHAAMSKLLAICQVDSEDALPTVWGDMAHGAPKMDRTAIQFQLEAQKYSGSAQTEQVATCSQDLATNMSSLIFIPPSQDDLLGGGALPLRGLLPGLTQRTRERMYPVYDD